jgi:hypothetical protein
MIFYSPKSQVSIGNLKGNSLRAQISVGNVKGNSLRAQVIFQSAIVRSDPSDPIKGGYAFISWVYDALHKRAVGTVTSPLYRSAQFKLKATDGLKNTRDKKIKNPQEVQYTTA